MGLDTSNALISLGDFKLYIGQSTSSTSYGARYEDIINAVSWRFNDYTKRKLKARSITEYRDGNGTQEIYTREWPINSNSTNISIYIDEDRAYSTSTKVSATSIVIYSTPGRIYLDDDTMTEAAKSVKLVYNGGYSTIPYDLAYACKEMCRLMWKREQTNLIGVKTQNVEGQSISFEEDLPWSVKRILNMYKRDDSFK